jgi:hypothetical protein
MKVIAGTMFVIMFVASCAMVGATDDPVVPIKFSNVNSDYYVTDENSYGCRKIDFSVIEHILSMGEIVSEREVHDHYSITGCSIRGTLNFNGTKTDFLFDYGGVMQLGNGKIVACGEKCCINGYQYCSYDANELKGD